MDMTQQQPYQGFFKRLNVVDWLYAAALMSASCIALFKFSSHMDYYEQIVLLLAAPTFALLGWNWKPIRVLILLLALFNKYN